MINLMKRSFNKIREINRQYQHPKIHQSRTVQVALFGLRIYLLVLVVLLVYKFVTTLHGG